MPTLKDHNDPERFCSLRIYAQDIVDISYRGKSVYHVSENVYAEKLALKEVSVAVYEPTEQGRSQMYEEKPGYGSRCSFNNAEAFAVSPDKFLPTDIFQEFSVGAHSNALTICSDVLNKIDENYNKPGNLLVIDGQPYMLDAYSGIIKMPFHGAVLESVHEHDTKEPSERSSLSLADRAKAAQKAIDVLNINNTSLRYPR